jgi:hypothetical protein
MEFGHSKQFKAETELRNHLQHNLSIEEIELKDMTPHIESLITTEQESPW